MIDAWKEAREANERFSKLGSEAQNTEIRQLAEGLAQLAKAIQGIADPDKAQLTMKWPDD